MGTALPTQDISPALERDARFQGLANRLQALSGIKAAESPEEQQAQREELREASQNFEAMFLNLLLREMSPKNEEYDLFGNGPGSDFYRETFYAEISKVMSRTGQLGLAEMIEKQVLEMMGLDEEDENNSSIPALMLGRSMPQPLRRSAIQVYKAVTKTAEQVVGKFLKPIEGRVSSSYGMRTDPFDGAWRRHNGIDFAAPAGTPVRSAAAGQVKYSGWLPGYGKTVIVEHAGGYETRYAHNANNLVRKGELVKAGQVVASVGSTGRATGPHLHFEVRKGSDAVDPSIFLP